MLRPIDSPAAEDPVAIVDRTLGPLVQEESRLTKEIDAWKAHEAAFAAAAATRPAIPATVSPAAKAVANPPKRPFSRLPRQLSQAASKRLSAEHELGNVPRVRQVAAVTTPRLASNQRGLLSTALAVAGVVFPLAFIVALCHSWRYRRAATTQVTAGDRYMTAADLAILVLPSRARRRRFGAMLLPASGFAAVIALIAGGIACSLAPRRYSGTATLSAPATFFAKLPATPGRSPSPQASVSVSPAEAYAAVADAANSPYVFQQVVGSPQWKLVRGAADAGVRARLQSGSSIDVHDDAQGVSITFTDPEPEAARYGADAIMTAARNVVGPPPSPNPRYVPAQMAGTRGGPGPRPLGAEAARLDALCSVVRQLPAATVSVSDWPSNTGEIAATAVKRAAEAFAVAFLLAMIWLYCRTLRGVTNVVDDQVHRPPYRARAPIQLAAVLAVLIGLIGYAVAPRTYSATATVRVRVAAMGRTPAPTLRSVLGRISAGAIDITRGAAVEIRPETAEIAFTCNAFDPDSASLTANVLASLVAKTWKDRTWSRMSNGKPSSLEIGEVLREWYAINETVRVDVVQSAKPPRWAHQAQPIRSAALVTAIAFVILLAGLTLRRRAGNHGPAHRRGTPPPPLTAPRAGGARSVPA